MKIKIALSLNLEIYLGNFVHVYSSHLPSCVIVETFVEEFVLLTKKKLLKP